MPDANASAEPIDPKFVALVERHVVATNEGRIEEADALGAEIMAYAAEQAQANPTPELLRIMLADRAIEDGEWEVARQFYEEDLTEALQNELPLARYGLSSHCKLKLAALESLRGQNLTALELAREAAAFAQLADIEISWLAAVDQFGGYAVRAGRPQEAIVAIDEALAASNPSNMYAQVRAQLWTRRAEASFELGQHDIARRNLASARSAIEPLAAWQAAGIRAVVARGFVQEARLAAAAGDWPTTRIAWEKAVEIYRQLAEYWDHNRRSTDRLAETIAEFAAAAEAAGESKLAQSLKSA